jgi:hypothetical protein
MSEEKEKKSVVSRIEVISRFPTTMTITFVDKSIQVIKPSKEYLGKALGNPTEWKGLATSLAEGRQILKILVS